jgi:hypothetical protein
MTARAWSAILLMSVMVASCARAPSFDILGSYFPAWLVCLALALLLTVLARAFLLRLQIEVTAPAVLYPSLLAIFTFSQWLIFLR